MQVCKTEYSSSSDEKRILTLNIKRKPTSRRTRNTSCKPGAEANPTVLRSPKEPNPSFDEDVRGKWKSLKTRFKSYDEELLSVTEDWTLNEMWVRTAKVHTQEHEMGAQKNLLAAASPTEEAEWVHLVWVVMFFQAWGVFLRLGIKRKLRLFLTLIFKKCMLVI